MSTETLLKTFWSWNEVLDSIVDCDVPTIKLFWIEVVAKKIYFILFGIGEVFEIRQEVIKFVIHDFLLFFIKGTDEKMRHSLFDATITQICVREANAEAVSIENWSANSESTM